MSQAVNLAQKLDLFTQHWSPKIVSQFNGHDIMVAKLEGEFTWHHHDDTDDFFFVVSGHLTIELEDGRVDLGPGELYVIPKGVRHRPVAHGEVHVMLIEKAGTPNTGDAATAAEKNWI